MGTKERDTLRLLSGLPEGESGRKLTDFSDAEQLASWAKEAVAYLVETDAVQGSGEMLKPLDTINRAEMAQLLYNLLAK